MSRWWFERFPGPGEVGDEEVINDFYEGMYREINETGCFLVGVMSRSMRFPIDLY